MMKDVVFNGPAVDYHDLNASVEAMIRISE